MSNYSLTIVHYIVKLNYYIYYTYQLYTIVHLVHLHWVDHCGMQWIRRDARRALELRCSPSSTKLGG